MTAASSLTRMLADWTPAADKRTERITTGPALALAGLLDCPPPCRQPGDLLPPLWHWLYLLDHPAQRELGPDGHPAAGPFMPPIPHRRRMFAGGRVLYRAGVCVGDELTRTSELAGWQVKQGRSGELLFVTVRHTLNRGSELIATEAQDLVYRSVPPGQSAAPSRAEPAASHDPVAPPAPWSLALSPDPVLLFRFSALTSNAHRIHYDLPYATAAEGHPGLLVHGPLLALLCLELPRRHAAGRTVTGLSFRAQRPVYAGQEVTVSGQPGRDGCEMTVTTAGGTVAMTATVSFGS